jgi:ABC-type transport system involved in cytochrome c biogenesis permease subunit
VLRNTEWLTYHVVTVMMAYSAFALAMGVGHVQLASLALRPDRREWTDSLGRLLYGMVLVGCVLITAGIIFGAIWANKSWGRYWGWDPKETWSLITLLGYMAVLHGRRVNWFGAFGMAAASIICFQLVIMTYYGVNFVLGRGLHSYGFSSGGQIWVGLYVLAETIFVLWMWTAYGTTAQAAPTKPVHQPAANRR